MCRFAWFESKHGEISPIKNSPIKRLNFPLAGEISRWFRREKSQVINANCAKMFLAITPLYILVYTDEYIDECSEY